MNCHMCRKQKRSPKNMLPWVNMFTCITVYDMFLWICVDVLFMNLVFFPVFVFLVTFLFSDVTVELCSSECFVGLRRQTPVRKSRQVVSLALQQLEAQQPSSVRAERIEEETESWQLKCTSSSKTVGDLGSFLLMFFFFYCFFDLRVDLIFVAL